MNKHNKWKWRAHVYLIKFLVRVKKLCDSTDELWIHEQGLSITKHSVNKLEFHQQKHSISSFRSHQ